MSDEKIAVRRSSRFFTTRVEVEQRLMQLTGHAAWRVWVVLSVMADTEDRSFPSVGYIAKRASLTQQSVRNGLDQLVESDLLHVEHRFDEHGHSRSNLYTVMSSIGSVGARDPQEDLGALPQADLGVPPLVDLSHNNTNSKQDKTTGAAGAASGSSLHDIGRGLWLDAEQGIVRCPKRERLLLPYRSERFIAALCEWAAFRRHDRRSPLTVRSLKGQLKKMAEWGEAGAVAAMESSITNGYLGLFETKGATRATGHTTTKYDEEGGFTP